MTEGSNAQLQARELRGAQIDGDHLGRIQRQQRQSVVTRRGDREQPAPARRSRTMRTGARTTPGQQPIPCRRFSDSEVNKDVQDEQDDLDRGLSPSSCLSCVSLLTSPSENRYCPVEPKVSKRSGGGGSA